MTELATAYRTCPLCEATCGLEITTSGDEVVGIRGDSDDVFSHGFICPKGSALKALHEDPDRVRTPLIKQADGTFAPAGWDEAFEEIERRLSPILAADRNAVGAYIGNPSAHNLSALLYGRVLLKALGTRNLYSASTVDQYPKQMASALMFGTGTTVAIPDIDRTDHLLILGANPLASNGSLLTAPNMRGRLRAIRERDGKIVVFDPRRSRTAEESDEHHFIRPGTDAHLLFALVHVLFDEGLTSPGPLAELTDGIAAVEELARPFTPDASAAVCGIGADEIRRIAREFAAAPRAAVYGRIGTTTQEFGTLTSWLVDVINLVTGNLDREGGAMFPKAAAGARNAEGPGGKGRGAAFGRWGSRVRGLGELFGELPVACMAEEIDTPGEGQLRALFTIAGNPVVSTPNSGRLDKALAQLELMVCIDVYVNETTRHADVILPGPSPLERPHYDLALYQFAARNVANFSPALFEADMPQEWETLLRLAAIAGGAGAGAEIASIDAMVASELLRQQVSIEGGSVQGRNVDELLAALGDRTGPERLLDILLRCGPYGDGFGADADGLTLAKLESHPHGIDFGAMEPRLPAALRTTSGRIELTPEAIVADVPRLRDALTRPSANGLVLIGRRQLRSNNSWMHNLRPLVKGKVRCTLHVHPDTAATHALLDGEHAVVRSRAGEVEIPVEVTDAIMPGVLSIPHGWGHDVAGTRQAIASAHAGVNSNLLADERLVDAPSGNAVLNGIPVEVAPVRVTEPAAVA